MRVVVDPIAIFDGRCDQPSITEDPESGKCVVTIDAASHWVDFERIPGRHTNDSEQQLWFPGDRFFEHVHAQAREVIWGRPSAAGAAPAVAVTAGSTDRFDEDTGGIRRPAGREYE